ncbi:hypothetical protein [Dickeya fangzhongdai]|uniref:hypothetical protein n=1 Tax=Dickeya fangzhongdai TaxID=1778540 RepID=UPI000675F43E|nr:hypothetical protein [Dickeya fangzhongdai]
MEYLLNIDRDESKTPLLNSRGTFIDQKRFFFKLDDGRIFQKFIAVPFLQNEIDDTLFELKIINKDSYRLSSCGELHDLDYFDNEIRILKKHNQLSLLYTPTSLMYKYLKEEKPHLIFMSMPLLDDHYCHNIHSPIPMLTVTMVSE